MLLLLAAIFAWATYQAYGSNPFTYAELARMLGQSRPNPIVMLVRGVWRLLRGRPHGRGAPV